jgi:hypothetical protein
VPRVEVAPPDERTRSFFVEALLEEDEEAAVRVDVDLVR